MAILIRCLSQTLFSGAWVVRLTIPNSSTDAAFVVEGRVLAKKAGFTTHKQHGSVKQQLPRICKSDRFDEDVHTTLLLIMEFNGRFSASAFP